MRCIWENESNLNSYNGIGQEYGCDSQGIEYRSMRIHQNGKWINDHKGWTCQIIHCGLNAMLVIICTMKLTIPVFEMKDDIKQVKTIHDEEQNYWNMDHFQLDQSIHWKL